MEEQRTLSDRLIEQQEEYAFFFLDVNGVIKTWNGGVKHLLGYSESEWIGQQTSMIFTPRDQSVALCDAEMRLARETGSASDVRWHRKKDGTEFFAHGVLRAIHDASGELIGFTKIIADETERKRLEDSLLQANFALEHFTYTASHDLQEPLRTIRSYAQLLLRDGESQLSSNAQQYLTFITAAASRMRSLVQDLLAYARAGVENQPRISVSLDDEVESALSQLAAAIEETGAQITHDPLPAVTAEFGQITRLFLNLIGNAIKYTADRVPAVHISALADNGQWTTLSVADNGIGFAEEDARRIFEPFTRLHARESSGSGVGLAICRRIVERYGGRIWAESKPGEGSTFFLTLPRSRDK